MSVQTISEVLKKIGTFTQLPKQTQEAYEELFGHSRNDLVIAFKEALTSGNEDLVLFTLTLISDYFTEFLEVLPEVRGLVIDGTRLEQAAGMMVLREMRDSDTEVVDRLRELRNSDDRNMAIAAAGTLLLCYGCEDGRKHLEEQEDMLAEGYLQEWRYQRWRANESDTEGIYELLSMRSASDAELITELRGSGQIEFELVATHDGKIVAHVAFAQMTMDTNKPVDAILMLPVVVHPEHLEQEIDSDLVFEGVQKCEKLRKRAVFTYGQSEVVSDLGFDFEKEVVPQPSLPEWMSLELLEGAMDGVKGKASLSKLEGTTNG
jgi:predicted N-acetyltransferase YhbS